MLLAVLVGAVEEGQRFARLQVLRVARGGEAEQLFGRGVVLRIPQVPGGAQHRIDERRVRLTVGGGIDSFGELLQSRQGLGRMAGAAERLDL